MQLFIAFIYMIGKITSNVGQTIFGTIAFIAYFISPRSNLYKNTSQCVVPTTAIANMIIVFASRFPSLNTPERAAENDLSVVNHLSRRQRVLVKCLQTSGVIYGAINILNGSFIGGTTLVRYPLLLISNDALKLLISSVLIAYIAVCSAKTFYSYNFKRISQNAEKFVEVLSHQTIAETIMQILWMNKKTLLLCAAGTISYLGFTYIMTKQLFHEILGDQINSMVVKCVSLAALLPALIAQLLSVIVSTWEYIEEDKKLFTAAHYHPMHKLFIGFVCIMALIEVTSTGLGNFVGTTELVQDFLYINPYSWLAYIISGIAGASSAFQEYTFNALTGIKNVADCTLFLTHSSVGEEALLVARHGLFSFKTKQGVLNNAAMQENNDIHTAGRLLTYGIFYEYT